MFELKHYQQQALDKLKGYFQKARDPEVGPNDGFYKLTRRTYCEVPGLPGLPYVCLRVPTGGGKTVMACHAVGVATQELMQAERSVVLWLVPTKQIKDQTLKALRDRRHPYREALEQGLGGGSVAIMELSEALTAPRSVFDGETCVIISTLAASRVQDEDNRKVYEANGSLMSHFQGLSRDEEARLDKADGAGVCYSLANVFKLRHPVVIIDEAHNARTELSFETLTRFEPACVMEFTATPRLTHDPSKGQYASNVIYDVSAWELKADDMIKMPVRLETLGNWRDVLTAALNKRAELEKLAKEEEGATGEMVRPILLIQAQPHSATRETLDVEEVERVLLEELNVPADWVRVATGERRGIDGEDLFADDCSARVIITVKALAEGWDCSFAYVLCSVAEIGSAVAVEQVLGRILRLPNAKRKRHDDLNAAYAFVASAKFGEMAQRLKDGLISNGFDKWAAQNAIRPPKDAPLAFGLFSEEPSPAEKGERLQIPVLSIREGGQARLLWPEDLLPGTWRLSRCDASMGEAEFRLPKELEIGEIDIAEEGLTTLYLRKIALEQQALFKGEHAFTREKLAYWLDSNINHQDILQEDTIPFLLSALAYLEEKRGIKVEDLTRHRFYVRDRLADKIEGYRRGAKVEPQNLALFEQEPVEVASEVEFTFPPDEYPVNGGGAAGSVYRKHYYGQIGAFDSDGEEKCANMLDHLEVVETWVRNIAGQPRHSFWLPWRGGKFYPDFVAKLNDGRIAVIEYRGGKLTDWDESREKKAVGELWEAKSSGRGRFLMVNEKTVFDLGALL